MRRRRRPFTNAARAFAPLARRIGCPGAQEPRCSIRSRASACAEAVLHLSRGGSQPRSHAAGGLGAPNTPLYGQHGRCGGRQAAELRAATRKVANTNVARKFAPRPGPARAQRCSPRHVHRRVNPVQAPRPGRSAIPERVQHARLSWRCAGGGAAVESVYVRGPGAALATSACPCDALAPPRLLFRPRRRGRAAAKAKTTGPCRLEHSPSLLPAASQPLVGMAAR